MHVTFRIGVLASSREATPRLAAALRGRASITSFESTDLLLAAVASRSVDLSIIEVHARFTEDALYCLRQLVKLFPAHPRVVWCDLRTLDTTIVLEVARLGVQDLLRVDGEDLPHSLGRAMAAAMQRTVSQRIVDAVGSAVPPRLQPVFQYALEQAGEQLDRDDLAAAFGISRRTLLNRLTDAGLPAIRPFLTWSRLLVATALLEQPGFTMDAVAGQLDYPDSSSLSNTLRRYTGMGIMELRKRGALETTAKAFVQSFPGVGVSAEPEQASR